MRFLGFFLFSLSCAAADDEGTPCEVGNLDGGVASADVGGTQWFTEDGTWSWTGDGLQVVLDETVGFQMTLRMNKVDGGDSIRQAVDADALPARVAFSGGSGTASVRENRAGQFESYATNQPGGGGHLWLSSVTEDTVEACFQFDAATSDGLVVDVTEGQVRVGS